MQHLIELYNNKQQYYDDGDVLISLIKALIFYKTLSLVVQYGYGYRNLIITDSITIDTGNQL